MLVQHLNIKYSLNRRNECNSIHPPHYLDINLKGEYITKVPEIMQENF